MLTLVSVLPQIFTNLGFAGGNATVTMGGLVNLGGAGLAGASSTFFTLGTESLLIVPTGFDPYDEFGVFVDNGSMVHQAGSTLTMPFGKGFAGKGIIDDRVVCEGWIEGRGDLRFAGGLAISDKWVEIFVMPSSSLGIQATRESG